MRSRLGGPWRWLLGWLFRHVKVSDEALASVRRLTEEGTVVYVSRTAGLLPFLYFNWLFLRAGLPLARYVGGVRPFVARFFGKGAEPPPPLPGPGTSTSRLAGCVAAGRSALVFLWERGGPLTGRKDVFPGEQSAALVRLQREGDRPIFLLPCLLLFGRQPERKGSRPGLLDLVFGPRDAPGRLRSAMAFLRFRRSAWVKFGEAIDLSKFIEGRAEAEDVALGRKVRGSLSVYLAREQRVVTGPPLKHPDRLRMEVLRDRRLRATLAEVASETGRRETDVLKEARRDLKEIAARYSPTVIGVLERFFRIVFHRIYDGIEVDRAGLEKVANAARRAPLILCPSHRSHIDYLVLSWVFYNEGLMPPHIAAGKNLSFWPAGPILRRGGAFFIRRTFRDDRIYSAVFRAYVRRLIHEGYPQEFFIEGTRSRTGKLLPPRLGMVAYEVEAFLESARDDLVFVPISIGYTRVIEQKSYRDELLGGEKQAEDVTGLLKAGRVLRRRWGRIYIEFDEPISLSAFMAERKMHREEMDEAARSRLVRSLAWHITHGIDRSTTVSPAALTAAALLSDRRRGLEISEIVDRARFLFGYVTRDAHPRISGALVEGKRPHLDAAAVEEAVGAFADDGLVKKHRVAGRTVVEILPDGRLGLDYYKNLLLRHVAERSLLAHALLATVAAEGGILAAPWLPLDEVRRRAHALTRLLSREFVFRPGVPPDRVFDETLDELVAEGFVERKGSKVRIPRTGEGPLSLLRLLTASVVEGYWLTARAAAELLAEGPVPEKDLVRRILDEGRVLVLTGRLAASEALSKPVVQGALGVLVEWGLLAREGRRGEAITGDPAGMHEILEILDAFVLVPEVVPQPRLPSAD
jgi:glycerol-3-phosphate O-acyltransferase